MHEFHTSLMEFDPNDIDTHLDPNFEEQFSVKQRHARREMFEKLMNSKNRVDLDTIILKCCPKVS